MVSHQNDLTPLFYLLLTTFMMDLSQAMDFCSCWIHMANWAALRTSVRAFLHTFIPWATSSSPLGEDNEVMRNKNAHTYVNMLVYLHAHKQQTVSVEPAANETADLKELQLCGDRHEDFRGVGHQGEVHTDFCYVKGTFMQKE